MGYHMACKHMQHERLLALYRYKLIQQVVRDSIIIQVEHWSHHLVLDQHEIRIVD